jgi:predicted enzyme related to lactoylglutathione lyase
MYVGSSNRRAGIGESLLKAAIRQAEAWNILQVVLSVTDVAKDARRLYERHGFRSWGLEPRAMCVDGVYADEAYMTLQLDGSVDPAPKRWSVAPYFIVDDVVATANYYRDKLGFNYERFWNDPPSFCMVEREGIVIMLGQLEATGVMRPNRTVDPEGGAWDTYIYVGDADGLHSEFKSKGVKIVREISDRPYGCRDFDIDDCNGYRLCFGQILGEE